MTETAANQRDQVVRVALTEAPPTHQFVGNTVPIGVAGFALTTFTLGLYTSGQFNAAGELMVMALAAFYGGATQWIAGWFALRRGDLFPAAFMTTYGAFWFSFVALNLYVVPRIPAAAAGQAVTLFLCMWGVITVIFTVATLGTNWAVFLTFVEFDITLIVLIAGSATGNAGLTQAGGYLEMLLGAMAWYIVMAEVVNETLKKPLLPLFPFRKDRTPALAEPPVR